MAHVDPRVRRRGAVLIVAGLSALGGASSRLDVLTDTLKKSDDLRVRFRAVQELGELGSAHAVPALIDALRPVRADPRDDWFVRRAAVISLARLGAVEPLVKGLEDPSPLVRAGCLEALALTAEDVAREELARALTHDPAELVRLRAVALLDVTGPGSARAALRSAADTDESARVRERAQLVLKRARGGTSDSKRPESAARR